MIPVTITPASINLLLDGRMRTVSRGHINFNAVSFLVKELGASPDEDYVVGATQRLRELLDIPSFIAKVTEGRVQIADSAVMFDGKVVHGVIAERLCALLKEGHDVRPLARFLERVSKNPVLTARDEIYLFMESGDMPLTSDGCFLAFKKVGANYESSHLMKDGSVLYNTPGTIVKMDPADVDTDRAETCSRGLHFCSWPYLPQFGGGGESKVVIVKVAPEHVFAIPYDYNNSKGRACQYAIIGEVPEDECRHLFENTPSLSSFGLYEADDEYAGGDDGWDSAPDTDYPCVDADYPCVAAADCPCACSCSGDNDEHLEEPPVWGDTDVDNNIGWADLKFAHSGKVYGGVHIAEMVEAYGQRGFSRASGIPRTTIQEWLKRMIDAGWKAA